MGQTYGNGVHAYFSGDYLKAHRVVDAAIDAGSHDPRCYYFRGLAYLNLGRPQDAESDFQQGAKLETGDLNRTYNVAKSLERVQGPARLELEQYRAAARMAALEQAEKLRKQRYEELNREERRALESQAGPPPAKRRPGRSPLRRPKPDNPFAEPPAAAGEKPAEGPEGHSRNRPRTEKKPSEEAAKSPEAENPFAPGGAEEAGGQSRRKCRAGQAPAERRKAAWRRGREHLGGLGNAAEEPGDQGFGDPPASAARKGRGKARRRQGRRPESDPFGS